MGTANKNKPQLVIRIKEERDGYRIRIHRNGWGRIPAYNDQFGGRYPTEADALQAVAEHCAEGELEDLEIKAQFDAGCPI